MKIAALGILLAAILIVPKGQGNAQTSVVAEHGIAGGRDVTVESARIGQSPEDIRQTIGELLSVSDDASDALERVASALGMGRCELSVALLDPANASRSPLEIRDELARLAAERDSILTAIEAIPESNERARLDRRAAFEAVRSGDQRTARKIVAFYGIAAGRDVRIGTYIAGWTADDVTLLKRSVAAHSEKAAKTIGALRGELELTECAVRSLLLALGEQAIDPSEYLDRLPLMARRYRTAIQEAELVALQHPELYNIAQSIIRAREDRDDARQRELTYRLSDLKMDAAARDIAGSGFYYLSQLKFSTAAEDFLKAATLIDKVKSPDLALSRANYLTQAGLAQQEAGKLDEAGVVLRNALAALDEAKAPTRRMIRGHADVAFLELARNRLDEAGEHLQKALSLTKSPDVSPELATTILSYWAQLRHRQGEYEAAAADYAASIKGFETVYGMNDIRLAPLLCNAADLLWMKYDFAKAKILYERGLSLIPQKTSGGKLMSRGCRNGLASMHWRQRNLDTAAEQFGELKRIAIDALGQSHREVAVFRSQLGQVLIDAERYDEAESELQTALALAAAGPDPLITTTIRNNLGTLHFRRGKYDAAEKMFRLALDDTIKQLDPFHPAVATRRANLGRTLEKLDRIDEAELEFQQAKQILIDSRGPEDPETIRVSNMLGDFYVRQQRWSPALAIYEEALLHSKNAPGGGLGAANRLVSLGDKLVKSGEPRAAARAYEQALPIYFDHYGRENARTAELLAKFEGAQANSSDDRASK